MKNVLRDLIDDEIVNMIEYSFDSESDASTNEFVDLNEYVDEFEQKSYQSFAVNRAIRRKNDRQRVQRRHDKRLKFK